MRTLYTPRIVAFLDILGFSALTSQVTSKAEATIAFIEEALRAVTLEKAGHTENEQPFDVRLFSDCICLVSDFSVSGAAAILDSVAYLSLGFATKRIPLRGGLALGRHFHSENMIFSEALVNAYKLESELARWPRTLVSADVVSVAREKVPFLIRVDTDGQSFVDYLEYCSLWDRWPDHPYDEHKACIMAGLSDFAGQPAVLEKYQWLERYHNQKLRELAGRPNSRHIIHERMYVSGVTPA